MRRYTDYINPESPRSEDFELTEEELKKVQWTQFKIVVPTDDDKIELMEALHHIHNSEDFDSDIITLNQLGHEYLTGDNIIVDPKLYHMMNS